MGCYRQDRKTYKDVRFQHRNIGRKMTTIIAYQGEGYSLLCSDSRISSMDSSGLVSQISTTGGAKIATNGKYLLGAAGDMRAINILHHAFTPPTPPTGIKGLDKFITVSFIPELRKCFDAQGYSLPERDSSEHIAEQGSTILVSVNGVIYVIDGDYSWASDTNRLYALGTGAQYALGALQILAGTKKLQPLQAKSITLKAINVASRFDPHTGSPFHTFIQQTK